MTDSPSELRALHIADPPERWRALGFEVNARGIARVGGIDVHLGGTGDGITGLEISGIEPTESLDGLATAAGATGMQSPQPAEHPNRATAIDHVVITTPDLDRTARALQRAGIPLSRIANVRSATIRQGFRRLGPAILELVENPTGPAGPAAFWGLVFVLTDLSDVHPSLAAHLSLPRPAVQSGRRIATLDRAAGLSPRIAFMDPDRLRQSPR